MRGSSSAIPFEQRRNQDGFEVLEVPVENPEHDLLLGLEEVIDAPGMNAGLPRDLLERRRFKAALPEELAGGFEDPAPRRNGDRRNERRRIRHQLVKQLSHFTGGESRKIDTASVERGARPGCPGLRGQQKQNPGKRPDRRNLLVPGSGTGGKSGALADADRGQAFRAVRKDAGRPDVHARGHGGGGARDRARDRNDANDLEHAVRGDGEVEGRRRGIRGSVTAEDRPRVVAKRVPEARIPNTISAVSTVRRIHDGAA